jgi:hypothetical protein
VVQVGLEGGIHREAVGLNQEVEGLLQEGPRTLGDIQEAKGEVAGAANLVALVSDSLHRVGSCCIHELQREKKHPGRLRP